MPLVTRLVKMLQTERPAELQLRCTVQPLVSRVCRLCFDSVKWQIPALVPCAGIIFVRVILSCAGFFPSLPTEKISCTICR